MTTIDEEYMALDQALAAAAELRIEQMDPDGSLAALADTATDIANRLHDRLREGGYFS